MLADSGTFAHVNGLLARVLGAQVGVVFRWRGRDVLGEEKHRGAHRAELSLLHANATNGRQRRGAPLEGIAMLVPLLLFFVGKFKVVLPGMVWVLDELLLDPLELVELLQIPVVAYEALSGSLRLQATTPLLDALSLVRLLDLFLHFALNDDILGVQLGQARPYKGHHARMIQHL